MKSNTAKGFVVGVLVATMMSSTNVFADAFEKVINIYTGINVYVNDVKLGETNAQGNPNAFIYNGTTYASVNDISKALGQNVIWDGNSRSLYVGKHEGSNYYLMDVCPPYETGRGYQKPLSFKMAGKEYTNGFLLGDSSYGNLPSFAIFNLNGKYQTLSFTVSHIDESYQAPGIFNIFLDGKLVKRIEMNYSDMPKKYTIPLNGAVQLKIEKNTENRTLGLYGFADIVVK